jgi:hypothetical protein
LYDTRQINILYLVSEERATIKNACIYVEDNVKTGLLRQALKKFNLWYERDNRVF